MKKAAYAVIIFTVMLCIFVGGFLLGRNANKSDLITVSPAQSSSNQATEKEYGRKININQAGEDELTMLPGIGPALAKRIVEYRENVGPFRTVQDLQNVSGIGEHKLQSIIDYITT